MSETNTREIGEGRAFIVLRNASICHEGVLLRGQNVRFSSSTGLILSSSVNDASTARNNDESTSDDIGQTTLVDLEVDDIVAPGLIELQTNGLCGIHFTTLTEDNHGDAFERVSQEMAKNGVTAWYATIPTVEGRRWKEILPLFRPRAFESSTGIGSPLLGAHVEGPYLHPLKKGAHDDSYFKTPSVHPYRDIYGEENLRDVIKYITIAPELDGALDMIRDIRASFPHIVVAIGHSTASYETGVQAVQAGANSLTHIFNAMNPLHHRDPGLAGTIGMPTAVADMMEKSTSLGSIDATSHTVSPYFTMIPDLVHLHPAVMRICYHSDPSRCILITDSIELAGLPDGIYPPNGQITYAQRKQGNRATNVADSSKGEKETLIGSCITLPEGVKNMMVATGVGLAEAVRCASSNIADLMHEGSRGRLVTGRRADFVVLDRRGYVRQTWIGGRVAFRRERG